MLQDMETAYKNKWDKSLKNLSTFIDQKKVLNSIDTEETIKD